MRVENFQYSIYGNKDFDSKLDPNESSNGLSLFLLLSKCLKLADTSGDGILSEQEINVFKTKNSSDIIKAVQKEIKGYELELDDDMLKALLGSVKTLIGRNDEISESTENLKGISKEEFLKKVQEKISPEEDVENEETESEENNKYSNDEDEFIKFEQVDSTNELEEVDDNEVINQYAEDFNEIAESEELSAEDKFWKLIGLDGAEEIFDKIDSNKDGFLSEDELSAVAGGDNNEDNISLTDLSNIFNFGELNEAEGEQIPLTPESERTASTQQTTGSDETSIPQSTDVQQPDKSSSYNPSSGSDYQPSGNNGSSDNTSNDIKAQQQKRTVADIEAEIQTQEQKKTELKQQAQTDIQAKEGEISALMEQNNLSEEFKAEYNSENTRLQGLIDEKDTAISSQNTIIQDSNAKISSLNSAVGDISSQISEMKTQQTKVDKDKNADTYQDYTSKINTLETKEKELKDSIAKENEKITNANNQITTLNGEKTELQTQKDNILNTLSEKYQTEKDKVEAIKTQVENYQNEIKNIKTTLENNLSEVENNIQTLKTEKETLVQQEETQKILNENKVLADNSPYQITGSVKDFDWASIGYNAETGKKIADAVYSYAYGRTGNHQCLGGVKKGYNKAFGTNPFTDIGAGYQAAGVLAKNKNYREVTGIGINDLQYLPAGAVVSWSNSPGGSSPASKYGHCSVALGNGDEASDNVRKQYRHVGENGKPRVFIPITENPV